MSEYTAKNYTEQGGDVTHIGGMLIIEEGASVEGLPEGGSEYELPVASDTTLGGVKVGGGLDINESGVLSVDENDLDIRVPVATSSRAGIVKPGTSLEMASGTSGVMNFRGVLLHQICVQGTTADNNVTILNPEEFTREEIFTNSVAFAKEGYYVCYCDEYELQEVFAYMVAIGRGDDTCAYFRGYKDIGGRSPKEYLIGIDYQGGNHPKDVVYIRDLMLT